jgi:hypothetical protein
MPISDVDNQAVGYKIINIFKKKWKGNKQTTIGSKKNRI